MEVRELDQREYDHKLRTVIVGAEGLHGHVQDVGDGRATIGWGYTLNRNNNLEIWTRSGIELTPEQRATLERVDRAPVGAKTRVGLGFDRNLTEAESDSLFRASVQEYEGPAIAAGLPLSDARVAIVSVTYNRGVGALRDHPVLDAIRAGDRAEAWYQLRYNCWGSREDMEGGLRKRRFAEAEVFGLYDDRTNIPVEEAAEVYAMYRAHLAEIDRVERGFGVSMEGLEARPNRIAQANRDYPDIVAAHGAIRTISESLAPARQALIEHLRAHHPDHAAAFTEASFDAAGIDLHRFPIHRGQQAHDNVPEPESGDPAFQPADLGRGRQFDAFFLDRLFEATSDGDAASVRDITLAFARSSRGEAFLQTGERLLAQQQSEARESLEQQAAPGQAGADTRC